ncbi:UNVERIFIED_CONTAM: Plant intracellular Ras-group-related LRR protein 8 [Sesamum angustifolium]|uniref:Plant intracellular Ras-group-related LRR protein 8 n=1 Tax=Sesamum angustifolium TaxID=2727405 RepID=A0AAW2QT32_9LAMI
MDQQDAKQDASILKLNIKFSGRSIPVEIGADSTIKDLKSLLQPLTNVLPRGQKLIFKGKVLSDELRLASSGISDGAKIMLMASQGLHQGDGPVKKEAVTLPSVRRVNDITRGKKEKSEGSVTKSQLERWKATGVIALSDCGLTVPKVIFSMKFEESRVFLLFSANLVSLGALSELHYLFACFSMRTSQAACS